MLIFPDETHTTGEIFFQLIHEGTHAITDPLIHETIQYFIGRSCDIDDLIMKLLRQDMMSHRLI